MKFRSVFLSLLIACSVQAADPLDSVCFVSYRSVLGYGVKCTGTLISDQVVLTAGQCFKGGQEAISGNVSVSCGSAQMGMGKYIAGHKETFLVTGIRTYSNGILTSGRDSGVDLAMLRLDRKAQRVAPMNIPIALDSFRNEFLIKSSISSGEYLLRTGIECRTSWYEVNPSLNSFTSMTLDYSPDNDVKVSLNQILHDNAALVVQTWGDKAPPATWVTRTGAAFYCRKDRSSDWKLLGISSSHFETKRGETNIEFLASTFSPHFLGMWRNTQARWN